MSRGKDAIIRRYGGLSAFETPERRKARFKEIDQLEADLKSGLFKGDDAERAHRRLCELKGIDYDGYDDPND